MEKIYIYKTTNKINGKIYVGQHKYTSLLKDDGYLGSGKKIRLAIKKYGKENFSKEILTIAMSSSEADVLEKYNIEKYDATNPKIGYNLMLGGQSSRGSFTKETLERMSLAKKGKPSPKRGCHLSEETKKRISESHKGLKPNEETLKKLSESHKGKHWKLVDGKRVWF